MMHACDEMKKILLKLANTDHKTKTMESSVS